MTKEQTEHAVIYNSLNSVSILCGADVEIVIDKLTGYLFDEDESILIKSSKGRNEYNFNKD